MPCRIWFCERPAAAKPWGVRPRHRLWRELRLGFFGQDSHNTRSNTAETAIGVDTVANLKLLWEHTGVETTSTPAVMGGRLLFRLGRARLRPLGRGWSFWSKPLDDHPDADILSSAVPVDDMLIVGAASSELVQLKDDYTFRGSIVALAQDDGAERWRVYMTEDDGTSGAGVMWSVSGTRAASMRCSIGKPVKTSRSRRSVPAPFSAV